MVDRGFLNRCANASNRAKSVAKLRSAIASAVIAEEKARLEAELAEEGLPIQSNGNVVNFNVEAVEQTTEIKSRPLIQMRK